MKNFIFTITFLLFSISVIAQENQQEIITKPLLKKGEIRWLERKGFREYDWDNPIVNLLLNQALQKRTLGNGLLYGVPSFYILSSAVAVAYPPVLIATIITGPVLPIGMVWGGIDRISSNKKLYLAKSILKDRK